MTIRTTTPSYEERGFPHTKISRFIRALQDAQFSGQLIWTSAEQSKWIIYFHSGNLCYATGGIHAVRRWARNLAAYCPQLQPNMSQLQQDLGNTAVTEFVYGWEYHLFCFWVEQHKLTQIQAAQVMQSILSELLLDLLQAQNLTYQIKQMSLAPSLLIALDEEKAFADAQSLLQNLQHHNIEVSTLYKAPLIRHPERLQGWVSADAYQMLPQLLDGEKTIADLAVQARADVVQVAGFLLPYIQSELVELIQVPDLPEPSYSGGTTSRRVAVATGANEPLIACVDDSAIVCWTMEKLLTAAGYQFIGINDGFRAITTLLQRKPSLIFLDIFMPGTNGYEICRNLRKAPSFQQTPIVFLTGLDGVVDQVRARLAGASDFLSKPIDAEQVLSVITKHLPEHCKVRH